MFSRESDVIKEIPGCFHNDPVIKKEDLAAISVLNEEHSKREWARYISGINRHLMLLDDDEWPAKVLSQKVWYSWLKNWTSDQLTPFKEKLQSLEIPPESEVYVFWMREISIKTKWVVFCNNWINFLYEDEGCILVIKESKKTIILSNGNSWFGARSEPKT